MNTNRFFQLLGIAVLIVAAYLLVNAIGPKVGASSSTAAPVGFGELRLFEAKQNMDINGSSSVSPQALDAWGARYAGEAAALGADSGASAKALSAWGARYAGEAAAISAGSLSSGATPAGGAWNPDAFYAGGGG
jgi:hypothetical protein